MITQYVDGQRGVATTVYFTLRQPAASDSDLFYTSTAPLQADVKLMQDGTYDGTSDNAPAQCNSTNMPQMYSLAVSAAEMVGDVIDIVISDAAGSAFRDHHIQIRTKQNLSELDVDASNHGDANVTAVKFTGKGTGHGLDCTGGATGKDINGVFGEMVIRHNTATGGGNSSITLDANASATSDLYNGCLIYIISGTGAGQGRLITDYNGSTKVATVESSWAGNPASGSVFIIVPGPRTWTYSPGAELSAVPTFSSTVDKLIQAVFQRFFYKRTQSATTQTLYKVDDTTPLCTCTVSDSGTLQTSERLQ